MNKRFWVGGASCLAVVIAQAGVALAQAAAGRSGKLEEIVVTAQKVRTNVQKTPVVIQTVSGKTILSAGIANAKDLQRIVPSVYITQTGGNGASFFIRGVGDFNESPTNDPGIAVNLDQIFFSRAYGPDLAFYDLDRVEVLKGPQGTLYGINSTGGTINIISTKPVIGKLSGYARIEVGNYADVRLNGAVNLPISDTLAARVAFQTVDHKGYESDGYNNADTQSVRTHVLWKPTADLSLLLSAEYAHDGGKGISAVPYPENHFVTKDPWAGGASAGVQAYVAAQALDPSNNNPGPVPNSQLVFIPGSCFPGCIPSQFANAPAGPYQTQSNGFVRTNVVSLRADMEWNVGFATLSVIPALLNTDYVNLFYPQPDGVYNNGSSRQQSLEARLSSPHDQALTWIAGLFGRNERQTFNFISQSTPPNAYIQFNDPDLDTKNGGVFTQVSYKILPTLALTGGIRYSIEDKTSRGQVISTAHYGPGFPPAYNYSAELKQHDDAPTYHAGLDWQVTPANLLYVSYATGFHSGGLEPGAPTTGTVCSISPGASPLQAFLDFHSGCQAASTYGPEHLKAYAIGAKNRFFDNRLQLNLEAYDWEYSGLQISTLGQINTGPTTPTITGLRTDNAGQSTIRGVDADLRAAITRDDLVSIDANFNHSQYGTYVSYVILPFPPAIVNSLSGKPFENSPNFTLTANYSHDLVFGSGATLVPSITASYRSRTIYSYDNHVGLVPSGAPVVQPSFVKIDVNLTYRSPDDRYEVDLFARNLFDKATVLSEQDQVSLINNYDYVTVAPPRTYGGSVTFNF